MSTSLDLTQTLEGTDVPNAVEAGLAVSITQAIKRIGAAAVFDLRVLVNGDQVTLQGRCRSFSTKQQVQEAAMAVSGCGALTNDIEVIDVMA